MLAQNKLALFNYEILEKFEAGLMLTGQEVKSAKASQISLRGSYVNIKNGEAWLINAHISLYKMAGTLSGYDPLRARKLLLHKKEIMRLTGKLAEKGLTLVPLKVYTKRDKIKVEIGLAKGKKQSDKRAQIKKREDERGMRRIMRGKI